MNHKDLNVYQRAYKIAIDLHILLKNNIQEIDFTLANHLKRGARDVLGHIAEGFSKRSLKAKRYGYFLATESAKRILIDLEFMHDIKNFPEKEYKHFAEEYDICIKQLFALIRKIGESDGQANKKASEGESGTSTAVEKADEPKEKKVAVTA